MKHWTAYELSDDHTTIAHDVNPDSYSRFMREFRTTGAMFGMFFAHPEPGQNPDPEHAWEWGPQVDTIDWSDFPTTVQMIDAQRWTQDGLVAYIGDYEWAEEWLDTGICDAVPTLVTHGVQGWEDYTAIVALAYDDEPDRYYLVDNEITARLRLGTE